MAKKNNKPMIIDTSSTNLVCTEIPIQISDEKLKATLSRTYEKSRKDANKFKLYKHFGVFLSIGLTLLITLLTSKFNDIGKICGETLEIIFIIACCVSFVLGLSFLILYATRKDCNALEERDKAVNEIMNDLKQ